jgi:hypothetical protein
VPAGPDELRVVRLIGHLRAVSARQHIILHSS